MVKTIEVINVLRQEKNWAHSICWTIFFR